MSETYLHNISSLKIDLMLRGLRVEGPLGDVVARSSRAGMGLDLILPGQMFANIPYGHEYTQKSPYLLTRKPNGDTVITDGSDEVEVKLIETPDFYRKKTSTGVPLSKIGTIHGTFCVIIPQPRCDFYDTSTECKYCAGNFDINYGQGADPFTVDEVLETVSAVIEEKNVDKIYLSVGFSGTDDGGIVFLAPYIEAIKKHFNILVAVEALPPKENKWIDETYAVGADSVLYNLEIFDKELFELMCPGRAELIGHDRYIDALKYAAKIFPGGTVASHLIVGLEMPGSTMQGIDRLIGIGVVPILPIYRPSADRNLSIDPLNAEIILPVYKHLYKKSLEADLNLNWVRDISIVTTPIEGALIIKGARSGFKALFDSFYKSKIGIKAAWGLSSIRRKLRVKRSHSDN